MSDTMIISFAIILAVSLSAGGLAYVFAPALGRARAAQRVKSITQPEKARSNILSKTSSKEKDRRKELQETLKELEAQQKKEKKKISMQDRIERAGIELRASSFYISSVIFGLIMGAVTYFSGYSLVIVGAITFVSAAGIPRWVISFLANRRQRAFTREFANAIDIIVRGIKAGIPLNECLQIVANESPDPVGIEFRDLIDSMRMGVTIEDAMVKLHTRMPIPELNFFMIVIAIQQKSGGNLSEALTNLSTVLRDRKLMAEKIKAMSSEAKASATIIGSLPPGVTFMIYITAPNYINRMFETTTGNALLVIGGLWMATGVLVMKKMVSFKF